MFPDIIIRQGDLNFIQTIVNAISQLLLDRQGQPSKKFKIKNPQTACVAVKRIWDRIHGGSTSLYFKLPNGKIHREDQCWQNGTGDLVHLMEDTGMKFDAQDALTLLNELYEQLPYEY